MVLITSAGGGGGRAHRRLPRLRCDVWTLLALLIAAAVGLPLCAVATLALTPATPIWEHLLQTVLWLYVSHTLWLALGVGMITVLIGVTTAWLVTMYRFPGRSVLSLALLLPLTVPAYVLAFVITDQLEYAGTLQSTLRALFGWRSAADYWFPEIRSLGGAIAVLSLVLYPYVYLLARAAFINHCVDLMDVGRTLGAGPVRSFLTIALPLARPAIVVGATLALLETLNDYGTVSFFAVPTITAGIFDVWLNQGSIAGAAQLAMLLIVLVLGLLWVEQHSRRRQRYWGTTTRTQALRQVTLRKLPAALALLWCLLPVMLGFLLPAAVLLHYAIDSYALTLAQPHFLRYLWNSLGLALGAAAITVGIGILLAYGVRLSRNRALSALSSAATSGYGIPGAVLALGIIGPLAALDNALNALSRDWFSVSVGLLFSGTVATLLFGYGVRFMTIAYRSVAAGMDTITPAIHSAACVLGCRPLATLWRVHAPLLGASIITAVLLVFIDTLKELPLTLILRPFNFETLATYVFQYASDELLEECALGALIIVVAGLPAVLLLHHSMGRSRPSCGNG